MSYLSNGVTSIRLGVSDYVMGTDERMLSALRNLSCGLLLIFKEKLARLSPSEDVLVWERIEPKRTPKGKIVFRGVGRKTVNQAQILERFQQLDISFPHTARLNSIVRTRNEVEHGKTTFPRKVLRKAVSDAFVILRDFLRLELEEEHPAVLLGEETWKTLLSENEIRTAEVQRCRKAMKSIEWGRVALRAAAGHMRCPTCDSDLLVPLWDGEFDKNMMMSCEACGEQFRFGSRVEKALAESLGWGTEVDPGLGGKEPVQRCPECDMISYVLAEDECVLCRYERAHKNCERCGCDVALDEQDLGGVCEYCERAMARDH